MALHPSVYAKLLHEKIARHNVDCWLVNTGWSGGGYGVGSRMKIAYSRALINSAIDGTLNAGEFEKEPFFGLMIPKSCPDVPTEVLNPRNVWKDKTSYDAAAKDLAERFRDNFKQYRGYVSKKVADVL
jgi:phosphoenolpyruvate carboxykinase (ATP)